MNTRKLAFITAILLSISLLLTPAALAADSNAIRAANSLYGLGLFRGVSTNPDGTPVYELDRQPNRHEAITMLVRLLGKESEALSGTWYTPFTDVAEWAKPYVGYAYAHGLTDGTGAGTFGGADAVTAAQYITFVLRALGYESGTDFKWFESYKFSDSLGLTDREYSAGSVFTRGDAAIVSFSALSATVKGSSKTLAGELLDAKAVTADALAAVGISTGSDSTAGVITAEELYKKCSPAVFSIEAFDEDGALFNTGSGFFINSTGLAITNYHVLDFAYSASATVDSSGMSYNISGVYNYDVDEDWAVIQVAGSGFPYVELYTGALSAGASVYAIGSPMGLTNSISEGLVSYTSRELNGRTYIQTSASISEGSSGGALFDTHGRVIGITTATVVNGQNLNLAVPITLVDTSTSGGAVSLMSIVPNPTVNVRYNGSPISSLNIKTDESVILDITHDLPGGDVFLSTSITDGEFISASWGDWTDDGMTARLSITGREPGTSTVTIWLSNDQKMFIASATFAVQVS